MSCDQTVGEGNQEEIIDDFQNHVTNVPFNASLELSRCEDACCGCLRVHCPFCSVSCYKPQRPARVRDHINQTHFKHALLHREKKVLMVKCYKQCEVKPGHFHCPYCPKQLLKKAGFLYHLQKHLRDKGKSESLVQVPNFKQPEHILFDGNELQLCCKPCDGSLGKHYHCSLCKSKTFEEMGPLSDHLWRCRELVACGTSTLQVKKKTDLLWAENIVINTGLPKAVECYGDQCHISVVRNMGDLPITRCDVVGCCRHRFHCCLCPEEKFKPTFYSHIQEHYLSHWNNRVICGVYSCVVCYQDCLPQFGRCSFHFHCPKCGAVRRRKDQFTRHLQECVGEDMERNPEESGFEATTANMEALDDTDLVSHEVIKPDLGTRADNSSTLNHEVYTEQETTSSQEQTLQTKPDNRKIWAVFDKVTAHLSPELIIELSAIGPMEVIVQEVSTRSGVKVTEETSGYSMSGTLDQICLAKQILREKLPDDLRHSMEDFASGKTQQELNLPTVNGTQSRQTADLSPSRSSLNSAPCENSQLNEALERDTEVPQELYQNSEKSSSEVQRSNIQDSNGQALTEEDKKLRRIPSALDVLSSAVEIIKNEELGSESETVNLSSPIAKRRGRKRKQSKTLVKSSREIKTRQKDKVSTPQSSGRKRSRKEPAEDLMPRRYSTRGNKVDFSLLATGRKKKEPKLSPGVTAKANKELKAKVTESDPSVPSVEDVEDMEEESNHASEELIEMYNDEEHIEKESQESEDIVEQEQDNIENQSSIRPSKTKITFGSMAVIPNVTFKMQSTKMSKQLLERGKETETIEVKSHYFCVICETESDSFYDMVGHYSSKHEISEDLHCEKCFVICLSDDKKQEHLAGHSNGKEVSKGHACNLCDYVSVDFNELTDHIIRVHKTDCIRCDVCEREFSKHKSLDIHLSLKHGPRMQTIPMMEKNKTKCSTCPFEGDDFSDLTTHLINVHKVVSPPRCDVCERVFDSADELEDHLKKQHGPMEEHLISNRCPQCGLLCKNKHVLNQHQIFLHNKAHRTKKDIRLECKTCYFTAKTQEEIREHQAEHRRGNMKCPYCDAVYKNRPNLQFHIQLEHREDQSISCHICGQTFRHKRYIKNHMKRHSGIKTFSCETCKKDFYDKGTMVAHMKTHKDVSERSYRYICSYCGRGYDSKSNFTDHLNKHTGEKPYTCDICDKRFSYRSQLKQHKTYVHTKERPFKCNHCDRAFKLKVRLNQHMVSHTGISKYICDICSRPFGTFTALRNHLAKCRAGLIKRPQVLVQGDVVLAADSIVEMPLDSYVVINDQDEIHDLQQLTEGQEVTVHQPEVYACSVCKEEFEQYHLAVEHINTAHEDAWTDGQTDAAAETDVAVTDMTTTTFLVSSDTFVTTDTVCHTDNAVVDVDVAAAGGVSADSQVIMDQTVP